MQKKQMLLFLAFFFFQTQGKRVFLIQNTPSTSFRTHAHPHRKNAIVLTAHVCACESVCLFFHLDCYYNSILIKLSEKPGVDLLLRRRRFPTVSLSFALCFFFFLCFAIFFVHHHPDQRDGSGRAPAGGLHDGRSV